MTNEMTVVEICCDTECVNYNVQKVRPFTAEEVEHFENAAASIAEQNKKAEEEAALTAEAKASAQAKLSALGLTAEEIAALSK